MILKSVIKKIFKPSFLLALSPLLAVFLFNPAAAQGRPPAAVETTTVQSELVAPKLWIPGTVVSRQDSRIAAEVSGNLIWVAEIGMQVHRGDRLAQLNDRELQLQLKNNESVVARLKSQLEYQHRQVNRLTTLAKTKTTAASELDRLTAERDMLSQELIAAEVDRDRTLYDIERTRITAPFDGVVVMRMQQPGEYLERGQEVVRLVNTNALEIHAQVPLNVGRHVNEHDSVQVTNEISSITTKVRSIIPVGDEQSRMLQVILELNDDGWVTGEPVRISINAGAPTKALTVHRDALILRNGETYLFKVQKDNTVRRVNVVIGSGNGKQIAVTGDLNAGDQVVIRGAERLQDGATVNIVNEKLVDL